MKKTILVVEDEVSLQVMLKEKFLSEKFDVISANNGEEGLEKALKKHPNLILLDIVMPKMDGITMLKNLRKDTWGKDAAVILLTNLSDEDKMSTATDEKASSYLIKFGLNLDDLVDEVKKRLN